MKPHEEEESAIRWRVRCEYFQLHQASALISLLHEIPGGFTPRQQAWLLSSCISHPLTSIFPHARQYDRALLKAAVLAAEAAGEVDEALMQAFTCFLTPCPHPKDLAPAALAKEGWSHKVYAYAPAAEPQPVALQRLADFEARMLTGKHGTAVGDASHGFIALNLTSDLFQGGTGCHEWQPGLFMAQWVLSNAQVLRGRRCLELGSGAGMVGAALHRTGAPAQIACTDGNPESLANCAANLRLNAVPVAEQGRVKEGEPSAHSAVQVQQLVWEDGWKPGNEGIESPDVILGCDLLYDPEIIPTLLALLKQLLRGGGGSGACTCPAAPAAYLATLLRNETTMERFEREAAAEAGLVVEDVTQEAVASVAAGIKFCHLRPIEGPWERVVVHRLQLVHPASGVQL